MQYLPFLTILATALAGQSISTVLIRSGSQYQYAQLGASGSDVVPNGKPALKLVLNDDGSLVDATSQKYVNIGKDGDVTLSDDSQTGFSVKDNYLAHDENTAFGVEDNKIAFDKKDSGFLGVAVRVMDSQKTDDVKPGEKEATTVSSTQPQSTSTQSTQTESTQTESTQTESSEANSDSAPKKFGLIAIHSGSSVQNAAIKKVPDHPHVFSVGGSEGEDLQLVFGDDKTTLVDQNGKGLNLDQTTGELGDVAPFGRQPATTGFSIKDGHLAYEDSTAWNACPSGGDKMSLSNKDCTGGISIVLKVIEV